MILHESMFEQLTGAQRSNSIKPHIFWLKILTGPLPFLQVELLKWNSGAIILIRWHTGSDWATIRTSNLLESPWNGSKATSAAAGRWKVMRHSWSHRFQPFLWKINVGLPGASGTRMASCDLQVSCVGRAVRLSSSPCSDGSEWKQYRRRGVLMLLKWDAKQTISSGRLRCHIL